MLSITVNREIQVKTARKYYCTSTRMAKIRNTDGTKYSQGYGGVRTHTLLVAMQNGTATLEIVGQFLLKMNKQILLFDPAIPLLGIYITKRDENVCSLNFWLLEGNEWGKGQFSG